LLVSVAVSPAAAQGKAKASTQPGPLGRVMTIGIDGSDPRVVCEAHGIQAPNWTPDGKWLVCNGVIGGSKVLLRVAADGSGQPEKIFTGDIPVASNDHVLSPDGKTIYFTANQRLYAVPFSGGTPRRISNEHPAATAFKYFLHGVSPDNQTLAYVGVTAVGDDAWGRSDIYTIPVAGGPDTRLTDTPAPDDGPEYSPDGKWIYFNSELNAKVPGHSQCYPHFARREMDRLSQLSAWHLEASGQQGRHPPPHATRRQRTGRHHRVQWRPGHDQRQQLGARQPALRLCRLSASRRPGVKVKGIPATADASQTRREEVLTSPQPRK
jgi:Tol biopolymer transport system component